MPSCREVDPLVTPYIDGEASADQRVLVEAHLSACPPCRQRAEAETAARDTLRSRICQPCAPQHLRARCLKAAGARYRIGRWLAWLGIPALLALTVPLPFAMEAADGTLCDANPKTANLNFIVKDANGKDFNLASQKGKVILLDFWATWCPPCKIEIPWFVEFQSKYGPRGFSAIGISIDDSAAKLKPFVGAYKMNYPVLIGDGRDDVKEKAYGPLGVYPTTFVIGRDGKICKVHLGLSSKGTFEQEIKALL
jgi:anti-sigma factor (TIGR02949 family)